MLPEPCQMQKKRKFLHFPQFPGGKDEIKRYIALNLIYPEEAIRLKISGTVHLSAEVDDNGAVTDVRIEKGLGHGCDEEAVRLVSGLHYGGVTNRGLRLRVRHRFRILFDLAEYMKGKETPRKTTEVSRGIVYTYKSEEESDRSKKYTWQIPVQRRDNTG